MASFIQEFYVEERYKHWIKLDSTEVTHEQIADSLDSIIDRANAVWSHCSENLNLKFSICQRAGAMIDRKFHVVLTRKSNSFSFSNFRQNDLLLTRTYKITNISTGLSISVPILPKFYDPESHFLGYDRAQSISSKEIVQVLELQAGCDYKNKTVNKPVWIRLDPKNPSDYTEIFQKACRQGESINYYVHYYNGDLQACLLPFCAYEGVPENDLYLHLLVEKDILRPMTLEVKGVIPKELQNLVFHRVKASRSSDRKLMNIGNMH